MAAGLPVISTFHAGIPSVITNDLTGLLIKEWDNSELVKSIISTSQDMELRKRLGINGQQYACKNLDISLHETELEKIYKSLAE